MDVKETLSRRGFLRFSAGVATAVVAAGFEPTINKSGEYSEEIIGGIKVYGAETPIKTLSELKSIVSPPEMRRNFEREDLPENERFWEFVVSKSLYDKFANSDVTTSFPEWATFQVEKTNQMLASAEHGIPIRINLKRILVLDDSLYPSRHPFWKPEHDRDNFSRWAKDVDSRWAFNPDYYDWHFGQDRPIGPLNGKDSRKVFVGSYSEVFDLEEKVTFVDWGLIHELIHHLDVGDLYWLPPELPEGQFDSLPRCYRTFNFFSNDIMGSPPNAAISPLTGHAINLRASEGHRGVQPDGIRQENLYLMFPEEAGISLKTDSELLLEKVGKDALKLEKVSLVFSPDEYTEAEPGYIQGDSIRVNGNIGEKGWHYWYLAIEGKLEGRKLLLPFPRFIFNLSSWLGDKNPKYNIFLTGNDKDVKSAQGLDVKVVGEDEFALIKNEPKLLAWSEIPQAQSYLVWQLII